jgi:peptidoglycan hydrolase-like protein with peptidoglycan-binding domain/GH25 family lysozyme M1 (1,4-beta-N-acetylmuramidase)
MSTDVKSHSHGNVLPGSAGRLSGIDFSGNNFSNMSISEALARFKKDTQGQKFSFVKATQGTDYKNPYFKSQWNYLGQQVKAGKMDLRVAYGFLNSGSASSGAAQAKAFLAEVGVKGKLPAGTRLALDWETSALATPEVLKGAADYIHKVTGTWPIVYTSSSNEAVAREMVPNAPRWEANYGPSYRGINNEGGKILPSKGDTFDQYSDGRGYGLPYDMDVFNGSEAALRKFAGFSDTKPGLTATDKKDNAEIAKALKNGPLIQGASGAAVKALNRLMSVAGFGTGDGASFDAKTTAALQEFQTAEGLPVTGSLDQATFNKLVKVETFVRVNPGELEQGMAGGRVSQMEKQLGTLGYERTPGDGVFSKQDTAALEHFRVDDKLKYRGGVLGKAGEAALSSDVKALQHPDYRTRVDPSAEHTKLDAITTKAVAQTGTNGAVGLGLGSKGAAVADIQSRLLAAGFDPKNSKGDFDDRTFGAVEAFQRESGLPATGVVDPRTWAALQKSFIYTKNPITPPQSLNERGSAVLKTQRLLRDLGYTKVTANSLFGESTESAVKAFQKKHKMKETGTVDKATLDALNKAVKSLVPKEPTIRMGSKGAAVKKMQELLLKAGFNPQGIDGQFGPNTQAALMDYQYTRKLPVNGICGPKTWEDLLTGAKELRKPPKNQGTSAYLVARRYLGDAEETINGVTGLEYSGKLPMDTWPPPSEDCANFVSACLQVAGKLPANQHSDNVSGLKANLLADGWKLVPMSQAKPGDVVCFDGPLGPLQHVELFNAWVNGKPQYIGSNNIQSNGDQTICTDDGSYFDGYTKYVLAPPA